MSHYSGWQAVPLLTLAAVLLPLRRQPAGLPCAVIVQQSAAVAACPELHNSKGGGQLDELCGKACPPQLTSEVSAPVTTARSKLSSSVESSTALGPRSAIGQSRVHISALPSWPLLNSSGSVSFKLNQAAAHWDCSCLHVGFGQKNYRSQCRLLQLVSNLSETDLKDV